MYPVTAVAALVIAATKQFFIVQCCYGCCGIWWEQFAMIRGVQPMKQLMSFPSQTNLVPAHWPRRGRRLAWPGRNVSQKLKLWVHVDSRCCLQLPCHLALQPTSSTRRQQINTVVQCMYYRTISASLNCPALSLWSDRGYGAHEYGAAHHVRTDP